MGFGSPQPFVPLYAVVLGRAEQEKNNRSQTTEPTGDGTPEDTASSSDRGILHEAFMTTYNGTGAPAGWNWCLSYLATAGILIGFDASGHVAEETKNASITAARGIFWSTVASGEPRYRCMWS
jgi:amino acid transporter